MRLLITFISFLILSISFSQTTVNGSFIHNGLTRTYSFYVPAIYDGSQAYPLVLNLHGYTSNGTEQSFYGNFKPIADTAGFIVVHPEGTIQTGTASTQFWNVGFFPSNVDDIGFLESLIDTISTSYNIDATRIYSTGMSNGGFMSYKLACESNRFAAIASVTGSMTGQMQNNCSPIKPIPVMEIHGTADPTVPYNGQSGMLSIDNVLSIWAGYNGCTAAPTMTMVPNINTTDGATAEHYVYAPGTNNVTMEHYKVINGAHTWPGAAITIGVTCMDFSASKEIWRFFSQYSNSEASVKNNEMAKIQVYPNPVNDILKINHGMTGDLNVTIIDAAGKLMLQTTEQNQSFELDISKIQQGIYSIKLENGSQIINTRFSKF